jgi:predicted alpha/beta hydrolase family esterase
MPHITTVFVLPGWLGSGPAHWQSLWELAPSRDMCFVRVEQHDWQRPLRGDWCARLDEMVANHLHALDSDAPRFDVPPPDAKNPDLENISAAHRSAKAPADGANSSLLNTEQAIQYPRRKTAHFSSENTPSIILAAHSLGCHLVAAWAAVSTHTHAIRGALLVAPPDLAQPDLPPEMHSWRKQAPMAALPFPATCVISSNDPFASAAAGQAMATAWGAQCTQAGALGHINGDSGLGTWPAGRALLGALASNDTHVSTH